MASTTLKIAIISGASVSALLVFLGTLGLNQQWVSAFSIPRAVSPQNPDFPSSESNSSESLAELNAEEYKTLYKVRNEAAMVLAASHPQVKPLITDAKATYDFSMSETADQVRIKAWKGMTVEGNWSDGYELTTFGGKAIEVLVERATNTLSSVEVSDIPDTSTKLTFNEDQRHLIASAMQNPQVKEQLQGKIDGKDYYVAQVRNLGMGDRAFITLFTTDFEEAMMVYVTQSTAEITRVYPFLPVQHQEVGQ